MTETPVQNKRGRPRKENKDKDYAFRITALRASVKILERLQAANIPYFEAFEIGAKLKLSEPGNRTLTDIDRELKLLDLAFFDLMEKKDKLIQERARLISGAKQEAETQITEALE
jgi:hypothetical protein